MGNKCNTISINEDAVLEAIKQEYIAAMELAEEQLIQIMREEIQHTIYGGAPGKPDWRNEISGMLKEVYRDVTNNVIEMHVGLPDDLIKSSEAIFVKAMIIYEGSGSAVGRDSITAGPTGRMVWDDDMTGRHPSAAKTKYKLPVQFNQKGNHFIDNAVKRMVKHFNDVIEYTSASLPSAIFFNNVVVSG